MKKLTWIQAWFGIVMMVPVGGLFNYVIDPYGFNKFFSIDKINRVKEDNTLFTIKYKMPNLKEGHWDSLMLGTSRIGLMDAAVVDEYLGGKTFVMSQPGSVMPIQLDSFLYAIKFNNIKNVVYGIDFMSFNKNLKFNTDYVQLQDKLQSFDTFYTYDIYFNTTTLEKSIKTIRNNMLEEPKLYPFYSNNGMRSFPNYKQLLRQGNYDLDDRIKKHINKYFKKNGLYKDYEYSVEYMKMFEKIVNYCKVNDIKLFVYIPPMYVEHFYAFEEAGLREDFERFKKELVEITNFVDFTGINSVTVNKDNYWDSSHLKKEHTSKIMKKLIQETYSDKYEDFGIVVDKDNIDKHLQEQRKQYINISLEEILEKY